MNWLSVVVIFPSAVLAACKLPGLKDVLMDFSSSNVSWVATSAPSCLTGYQVCWTKMHGKHVSCDFAPPEATGLQIPVEKMEPCERFKVEVTAISHDHKYRDSRYTYDVTGPPSITGLKLTQQSRDLATLEWSPVSNHSCISNVELWLCENSTQELSTCFNTKMYPATVKFEFQNFEVCRYYYATMRALSSRNASPTTKLEMYLDSANEVTRVEASDVTQDSALITSWVSDVKTRCQAEKMKLCLQEEGGRMLPDCWEWTLDQDDPRVSIALSDLESCATYDIVVSLVTAGQHRYKTMTFTTPMAVEAVSATTESVSNTAAVVKWSYDVASTDCQPTVMQVCYSRQGSNDTSKMCRTLGTAKHSRVRLSHLVACTSYAVALTLLTSVGPQPNCTLSLVTGSEGVPVLKSINMSAGGSNVSVRWAPADDSSLQCVSHYNVSWSSGRARGWRTVDAGTTSFTIGGTARRSTYHVEVAAVLADGTAQVLSGDVVARSDSSRLYTKFPHLLIMLTVVFLRTQFHQ